MSLSIYNRSIGLIIIGLVIGAVLVASSWETEHGESGFVALEGNVQRGAVVFRMAGCYICHTDSENGGVALAGGREVETPFGTFVTPNITPDPRTGIGDWSLYDFWNAVVNGVTPDGRDYYPSFPYTSYTKMTLQDIADLKAYLDTVPPKENVVGDHARDGCPNRQDRDDQADRHRQDQLPNQTFR